VCYSIPDLKNKKMSEHPYPKPPEVIPGTEPAADAGSVDPGLPVVELAPTDADTLDPTVREGPDWEFADGWTPPKFDVAAALEKASQVRPEKTNYSGRARWRVGDTVDEDEWALNDEGVWYKTHPAAKIYSFDVSIDGSVGFAERETPDRNGNKWQEWFELSNGTVVPAEQIEFLDPIQFTTVPEEVGTDGLTARERYKDTNRRSRAKKSGRSLGGEPTPGGDDNSPEGETTADDEVPEPYLTLRTEPLENGEIVGPDGYTERERVELARSSYDGIRYGTSLPRRTERPIYSTGPTTGPFAAEFFTEMLEAQRARVRGDIAEYRLRLEKAANLAEQHGQRRGDELGEQFIVHVDKQLGGDEAPAPEREPRFSRIRQNRAVRTVISGLQAVDRGTRGAYDRIEAFETRNQQARDSHNNRIKQANTSKEINEARKARIYTRNGPKERIKRVTARAAVNHRKNSQYAKHILDEDNVMEWYHNNTRGTASGYALERKLNKHQVNKINRRKRRQDKS
jgi:hypothetical protein